jgi:LPXTG-motif cell wall-anchored protein
MTLDSLTYLLEVYWPFILGALLVGLLTGWFSVSRREG